MAEVGIREFRAQMRHWLGRVRDGEDVVITEHGKPVAKIVQADGRNAIQRLIDQGLISPARRPKRKLGPPRLKAKGSVSDIVIEQRG